MNKVLVLSIGKVKPHTGETMFDWNLYEGIGPEGTITLADSFLLYHANPEDFKIGEEVELRNNDSGRKVKTAIIRDQAPANREAVLEMLLRNQFDYYPTRAFKKKRFPRKLDTSYSVKGITV